jgi:hypothetical protein
MCSEHLTLVYVAEYAKAQQKVEEAEEARAKAESAKQTADAKIQELEGQLDHSTKSPVQLLQHRKRQLTGYFLQRKQMPLLPEQRRLPLNSR